MRNTLLYTFFAFLYGPQSQKGFYVIVVSIDNAGIYFAACRVVTSGVHQEVDVFVTALVFV